MSVESWKAEFFPSGAYEVTESESVAHSLKKWRGFTKENLKKHGVTIKELDKFDLFTMETCALCQSYALCQNCPIGKKNQTCGTRIGHGEKSDPYSIFRATQNPLPMIKLLEEIENEQNK
jgi:hypothetical protein